MVDPLKWVKIPLKINKSSLLIINTLEYYKKTYV